MSIGQSRVAGLRHRHGLPALAAAGHRAVPRHRCRELERPACRSAAASTSPRGSRAALAGAREPLRLRRAERPADGALGLARRTENRRSGSGLVRRRDVVDRGQGSVGVRRRDRELVTSWSSATRCCGAWSIARTRSARTCSSCFRSAYAPTTNTSRAASACCGKPSATRTPTR